MSMPLLFTMLRERRERSQLPCSSMIFTNLHAIFRVWSRIGDGKRAIPADPWKISRKRKEGLTHTFNHSKVNIDYQQTIPFQSDNFSIPVWKYLIPVNQKNTVVPVQRKFLLSLSILARSLGLQCDRMHNMAYAFTVCHITCIDGGRGFRKRIDGQHSKSQQQERK